MIRSSVFITSNLLARSKILTSVMLMFVALSGRLLTTAYAHEFITDGILIVHPSMTETGLYDESVPVHMILSNISDQPDQLLEAWTELGPIRFERPVRRPDGSTVYERVDEIDLPAATVVAMMPGQLRGRLEGLRYPLFEGTSIQGKLIFKQRGEFNMFFMVDPSVGGQLPDVDTPPRSPLATRNQTADDIWDISRQIRQVISDSADLVIAPIVVIDEVAVAGWSVKASGARALLRKDPHIGWYIQVWSGSSLLLPATLARFGIRGATATELTRQVHAAEAAMGAHFISLFDSFPGSAFPAKPCYRPGGFTAATLSSVSNPGEPCPSRQGQR